MKDQLIRAHDELQQIFVRGVDSIHMANAIMILENCIRDLEQQEQSEAAKEDSKKK